jgi:hypothetical protein
MEGTSPTTDLRRTVPQIAENVNWENFLLSHGNLPCEVPEGLAPLFELLDTFTRLAFLAGVGLATLGLLVAAIYFIMPGQDNNRRAKTITKNTLFGAVLLLAAQGIVSFLVNELGASICS